MVAAKILPESLQPPDQVHLPVRKMFEVAVADQPHHVLPVVVSLIGDLFLQDRADGNHGGKRLTEDEELQKEFAAQNTERSRFRITRTLEVLDVDFLHTTTLTSTAIDSPILGT